MNRDLYPEPSNGDVQHCQWYGDAKHITVHLWGEKVFANDSIAERSFMVRKCVVCGRLDEADLLLQHRKQVEQG